MIEAANDSRIEQLINSTDALLSNGRIDTIVSNFYEVKRLFRHEQINKSSSSYKPSFIRNKIICPLLRIAKTSGENNKKVADTAKNLLFHISLILSTINPTQYLKTLQKSIDSTTANTLCSIFPVLANIINSFDKSAKMNVFPLLMLIVQNSKVSQISNAPDAVFAIVAKYSPINELEKIIFNNTNNNNNSLNTKATAKCASKICNFRNELIKIVLTKVVDVEFYITFVKYLRVPIHNSPDLVISLFTKIGDVSCFFKNTANQQFASCSLDFISLLIDKKELIINFNERSNKNSSNNHLSGEILFKKLFDDLLNLLKNTNNSTLSSNIFVKILNILYKGCIFYENSGNNNKNENDDLIMVNKSELLPYIKTTGINDEYKIVSLKIMFLFPEDDRVLNVLAPFLLTFYNFSTNSIYSEYLETIARNYKKGLIDDDMLSLIINKSVSPLPSGFTTSLSSSNSAMLLNSLSILKFLNEIPKKFYKIKNWFKLNPYQIVYKYMNINDNEIIQELYKFVSKLNLNLNFVKFDFLDFGNNFELSDRNFNNGNNFSNFIFLKEIDFNFLNEFLDYRMMNPNNLIYVIEYISKIDQNRNDHFSFYFKKVLSLLYFEVKIIGFNLPKLYKELNLTPIPEENEHPWILQNDLLDMFLSYSKFDYFNNKNSLNSDFTIDLNCFNFEFENSKFGQLLSKTLEALFLMYQPGYEAEVAILTSCTTSLFCDLSFNIIETKINKSGKVLKEIIKILTEYLVLPMSNNLRISNFAINNLNVKTALSLFLPYLKESAEHSRAVADYLASNVLPSALTKPVPTFLSFVPSTNVGSSCKNSNDQKWKEYVDLCQQIIEPENWVILKTDKEKVLSLKDYNNGTIEKVLERIKMLNSSENIVGSNKKNENDLENEICIIDEREFHYLVNKNDEKSSSIELKNSLSLYELTVILWHSKKCKQFVENYLEMSFEELEELAFECSNNIDFLIGFFNYSSITKNKINLKRWLDLIEIENYNYKEILLISLFFENVHCKFSKLPLKISLLAQNSLTSFGYPLMTKSLLIRAFQQLTGIQWYFVRSLIGIDPDYFVSDFPIIYSEFKNPKEFFPDINNNNENNNTNKISLFEYFIGINTVYFRPTMVNNDSNENSINEDIENENEIIVNSNLNMLSYFPTNRPFSSSCYSTKMISFKSLPKLGNPPIKLREDIINDLIKMTKFDFEEKKIKPNPEILLVLMNCEINKEQRKQIVDVFLSDEEVVRKFFVPQLINADFSDSSLNNNNNINSENNNNNNSDETNSENNNNGNNNKNTINTNYNLTCNEDISSIFADKPPSMTLKIFRTIVCQFARPISQNLIQQLKLTAVHPALCYQNFAKQGIPIWSSSISLSNNPLSYLRAGILDSSFLGNNYNSSYSGLNISIMKVLDKVSIEAIATFYLLFKLDDRDLLLLKAENVGSKELIKSDIIKTLLSTFTINKESNVYFALLIMKSILTKSFSLFPIDELSAFICNREFLRSENFLCAAFIFLYLEKIASEMERKDIVSFCEMLKGEEAEIFEEEWKRKFVNEANNPDIIFNTFHK